MNRWCQTNIGRTLALAIGAERPRVFFTWEASPFFGFAGVWSTPFVPPVALSSALLFVRGTMLGRRVTLLGLTVAGRLGTLLSLDMIEVWEVPLARADTGRRAALEGGREEPTEFCDGGRE